MNCIKHNFQTLNKKSWSNHKRWCDGLMSRESFIDMNKGEKNGKWLGDKVGFFGLHDWVRNNIESEDVCEHCKTAEAKIYDWSNKYHTYKRKKDDWQKLCRSCHMKYDYKMGFRKKKAYDKVS